jgi:hypothetical protein
LQGVGRVRFGHALLAAGQAAEAEAQSRAGYELLIKRKDPQAVWLDMARQDLATAYRTLGRTADADRFQGELTTARAGR